MVKAFSHSTLSVLHNPQPNFEGRHMVTGLAIGLHEGDCAALRVHTENLFALDVQGLQQSDHTSHARDRKQSKRREV